MSPAHEQTLVAKPGTSRLAWIDWMRGLACVLMFQTHCYDAWLGGDARNGSFLQGSQLLGTLPAPLFLFLAGISFALVIDKLIRKNVKAGEITRTMFRRGAAIFVFGLLFRLQEFLIAWGWAPWSDLLRVDILNIIGLSMMLMALLCGIVLSVWGTFRGGLVAASISAAALIALVTPPLYTTWRPTWLPWWLESYIDGCHNLGAPQSWLFPLFPWGAFAFAGLAAGFILFSEQARVHTTRTLSLFAVAGVTGVAAAYLLDHSSIHLYSVYDYWHTSPNFLMTRVGILFVIAFLTYAWCRWGWATWGFSPLIQLGQTSLLVYWVHIEFVYGRFSLLPKRAQSIAGASRGLLEICLFMLLLSLARTRIDWKKIEWKKIGGKMIAGRAQPA
ncbi:MAG: heparan-alpha-glucosaminide N-acetyltransferase domain-containing protein [Terriglobales bacterium]